MLFAMFAANLSRISSLFFFLRRVFLRTRNLKYLFVLTSLVPFTTQAYAKRRKLRCYDSSLRGNDRRNDLFLNRSTNLFHEFERRIYELGLKRTTTDIYFQRELCFIDVLFALFQEYGTYKVMLLITAPSMVFNSLQNSISLR